MISATMRTQSISGAFLMRAASTGVRRAASALGGALAFCGNPAFFQFERKGPVETRLGPGVSRVSDSFWPSTEW
jgi:hypothetical protein